MEMSVVNHNTVYLQRLQRLHQATPECVVMFLAGSLPATALLHLRILGLLGMILRLGPDSILHRHGCHVLLNSKKENVSKSWFTNARLLSQKYGLPDPLLILQSPPLHNSWKRRTKAKVLDWWQEKYRGKAELLDS